MRRNGFTLIELIVVMAVVALLITIAAPKYIQSLERSKEATLSQTLKVVREAIDKYAADTGRYPDGLEDLATRRYIRSVPVDPVTDSSETWVVVPPPPGMSGKVYDVRSGAAGNGPSGKPYALL